MELFSLEPNATFHGKYEIGCYVAFGEAGTFTGKNAIPILDLFVDMVETILGQIEAESKRLGIIK